MILITPLPGITTTKPGSATKPFPGVDVAVYNEAGEEVGPGGGGYLVLKKPWPAMLRGIYGDDARYKETYWSKYGDVYFAGDGARIDSDGDFWLLGRVDDVMNVSGHRISTIEVESALVDHQEVAEAAVAARNDAMTGQAIVAFVTLKGGVEGSVEKLEELRNHVATKIGPIAKPANIVFTPELPKTRSGKIMRRLLRDVAENRPLGDTTTLADPTVVAELQTARSRGAIRRGLGETTDVPRLRPGDTSSVESRRLPCSRPHWSSRSSTCPRRRSPSSSGASRRTRSGSSSTARSRVSPSSRPSTAGPQGPPMAITTAPDEYGSLVVEAGWPVARGRDAGGARRGAHAARDHGVRHVHVGPYDELGAAFYAELFAAAHEHGLTPVGRPARALPRRPVVGRGRPSPRSSGRSRSRVTLREC